MSNQESSNSMEYLYAVAVLAKMLEKGIINAKVYETAVKKAKLRFNRNSIAA